MSFSFPTPFLGLRRELASPWLRTHGPPSPATDPRLVPIHEEAPLEERLDLDRIESPTPRAPDPLSRPYTYGLEGIQSDQGLNSYIYIYIYSPQHDGLPLNSSQYGGDK